MLVPLEKPRPPPGSVDRMAEPGAATSILAPGELTGFWGWLTLLKLLKLAIESSAPNASNTGVAPTP